MNVYICITTKRALLPRCVWSSYLQLFCSEGRSCSFGWFWLTVLFWRHRPLQSESASCVKTRGKWLETLFSSIRLNAKCIWNTYRSQQPVSGSPPLCRNGSDKVLSPPPARTPRLWTAAVCRRSRRSRPDGRHCLWLAVPSRWRRSAGHSGHTLYQTYCETEKGLGINTYP